MSVDLKSTAEQTGTVVSGAALLAAKVLETPAQPPRRFRRMIGWFLTGCFAVALLPLAWMLWDKIRPLSAHEQLLVGTWAVGSVDEIDRNDEELPGIPCGVPNCEYRFYADRTFHARKILDDPSGCLFSGLKPYVDRRGTWELRGNTIRTHTPEEVFPLHTRVRVAIQGISWGLDPKDVLTREDFGEQIPIIEWRTDGPLIADPRFPPFLDSESDPAKLHSSGGHLLDLNSPLL